MKKWLLFFVVLSILPLVSAAVIIEQPKPIYNIGDQLTLNVTLHPAAPTNEFLEINIVCAENSVNIYKAPISLGAGQQTTILISAILTKSLTGGILGQCNLFAVYGDESTTSQNFEISNSITVTVNLDDTRYDPEDSISLSGTAITKSGKNVNGFVEVLIPNLGVSTSTSVINGEFLVDFTIPKEAGSGEHQITIRVYENDGFGDIANEGTLTETVTVSQVLSRIGIIVSSQDISPGEDLDYTIDAYDQSDVLIDNEIVLTIYKPGDFVYLDKIVRTGFQGTLATETNFTPGYWRIEASIGSLSAKKLFYIEEIKKIQTSLINDTLIITNTGNIRYEGPIEIAIGSSTQIIALDLNIGESRKFKLSAPEGTYSVRVNDGSSDQVFGNVLLTGNSIRIDDLSAPLIGSLSKPIIWFFGIVLIILIIVLVKNKFHLGNFKLKARKNNPKTESVIYGSKEEAVVIALNLVDAASPYAIGEVKKALQIAKEAGGEVYPEDDYKMIVFSKLMTKSDKNELIALKVAKRISEVLQEYNRKFKEKLAFGIGVGTGQIVSEVKSGQLRFTTIGPFISKAKRLAQFTEGEVIISEEIKRKLHNEIKVEKAEGREGWTLKSISDRDKYKDFISKFTKKK